MTEPYTKFRGAGVALITPFDCSGGIDADAMEKLIGHVSAGGVDFLLALGTTAETVTMTAEEQLQTVSLIKKFNSLGLPVMAGMGGNCTAELVDRVRKYDFDGIDAILSVTPYYNKPSQRGLYEHFAALARVSPLPIFLYNVPGRTGVNILPETVIALAKKFPGVIAGIKEASGSVKQTAEIHRVLGDGFCILSGDDNLTPQLMREGAEGVVSVSINAFPAKIKTMVDALAAGDGETADSIHSELYRITELLFKEGNPTGIKALLSQMGITGNYLRLPLVPASENLMNEIAEETKGLI